MRALGTLGLLALLGSCAAPEATPVHQPGLENAYWITDSVLSGAQPEGEAAFRELAALGVKTVISVDGATPDVETARRCGLRYVHIPIGYDGVPQERALELAKAIRELDGPLYVHCHHGQHRGPAAAVVACVVAGTMDNARAVETMKTLGTGPQYIGLWESARQAKKAEAATLRGLQVEFREKAPIPPLAEAMVSLDVVTERLQLCAKAGWKQPAGHPDLDPAHEALRVREILAEIMRTEEFRSRPEDFRRKMEASRAVSERLETLLRAGDPAAPAFAALKESCADCHKPYRNTRPRK
ncbi:MAG TPA: hypothetical protein VKW04_17420 [Planctomycetota bacterium]|nr:hypothetical protein [Planctomycetota bacterium]